MNKLSPINTLMWIFLVSTIFILQRTEVIDTSQLLTSKENGWWSILTGPLLHGSFGHFSGNMVGLIIGTSLLINMYRKYYFKVVLFGFIIPPAVMYFLDSRSLGISGLVFATIWFVAIRGLLSLNWVRFGTGIIVLFFYGSSLSTALPIASRGIAWEAHLAGLITAIIMAMYSRSK